MKNVSEEEAQAKYERVVISSLQGYCLYLEQVTSEHIRAQAVINSNIISNGKFSYENISTASKSFYIHFFFHNTLLNS